MAEQELTGILTKIEELGFFKKFGFSSRKLTLQDGEMRDAYVLFSLSHVPDFDKLKGKGITVSGDYQDVTRILDWIFFGVKPEKGRYFHVNAIYHESGIISPE